MSEIRLLSQETIDKIAAGEVVERPASVVKEMVENAIDAKASAITVEIRDGGISMIRVTDNGEGIDRSQVKEAFLRHATSKITDAKDLSCVHSLGFRGEALSSISAVGQVELITRRESDITGTRFTVNGGVAGEPEEIGAPGGSTFIVRNLFYNTPARKKFLKSAATEAGYISDIMEHLALSRPEISFKFINNGQVKLHTSGNGSLRDAIYTIYGREIAANLLEVTPKGSPDGSSNDSQKSSSDDNSDRDSSDQATPIRIRGFIGKPSISRGNRNYENYFVEGRFVKNKVVTKAIEDGYGNHLMQHRYPFTVLLIEVAEGSVDVNVHPAKQEVRFADNVLVYDKIAEAVRDTLAGKELIPESSPASEKEQKEARKKEVSELMKLSAKAPEPFEQVRRDLFKRGDSPYSPKYGYRNEQGQKDTQGNRDAQGQERPSFLREETAAFGKVVSGVGAPLGLFDDLKTTPRQASLFDNPANCPQTSADQLTGPADQAIGHTAGHADGINDPSAASTVPSTATPPQAGLREDYRLIGQVFGTYWIVECGSKLYIIDQHAAHEKVIYERMVAAMKAKKMTSQQLLIPIIVTMSLPEEELFKKYRQSFEEIGFEVEHFGGKEYAIRAVPDNLYGFTDETLFMQMLDSLNERTGAPDMSFVFEKLAGMACKAAIKGNHTYSVQEANALIGELLTLENPYNCPHGRPTIISMSEYELERKFKRIVN